MNRSPFSRRDRRRSPGRTFSVPLCGLLFLLLTTCAKKEPITGPVITPGPIQGNRVTWTTNVPTRSSVRYSFKLGSWDHMAYPNAAGRKDRAFVTQHSVALLDLRQGRKVYYQTMDEVSVGPTTISNVDSFTATSGPPPNLLVSTMIDIGFGDSHLITFPTTGKHLLIDSGTRVAEASVETFLQARNVTKIDGMLATHVHEDHLGGEVGSYGPGDGVLASYHPDVFFDSPLKSSASLGKSAYREVEQMLASEGIPTVVLRRGQTSAGVEALRFDPQVRIRVLASGTPPRYTPAGAEGDIINNESIVLQFTYGDVRFVIGGDAQVASEAAMVDSIPASELEVEYFKVQHHGLSDANSTLWIDTLQPRVAFIPNTQITWDGSLASSISAATRKLKTVEAHIYVCDDAEVLEKSRSSSLQYNVSFVTDGTSYEVRLEPAMQPISRKPVDTDCGDHGNPSVHARAAAEH